MPTPRKPNAPEHLVKEVLEAGRVKLHAQLAVLTDREAGR